MTFRKMSAEELRLAKMWYEEDGMTRSEIADLLRRDKSTITRNCVRMVEGKSQGRKKALSQQQIDFLVRCLDERIVNAKGRYHVTASMLRRSSRMKVRTRRKKW